MQKHWRPSFVFMDRNNEAAIIAGLKEKDEACCKHFVHLHQDNVFGQAFRMLGNRPDAEEATQDAFIKAIERIHAFKGECKLSSWLFRITYTTCLDLLKKRKRSQNEVDIDDAVLPAWVQIESAVESMELNEQKKLINDSLEKMGGIDAMLIDLFHLQEMNISEIEEITGLKHSAVKVRLMRARKKLGVFLEQSLPSETLKELKHVRG